jgi:hypothetical protein
MADCVVIGFKQYGQNGGWNCRFGTRTRRHSGGALALAIGGLAICACPTSAVDAAEQKSVIIAIGTLLGAAEEAMAVMNHCGEVDPTSKDMYDGLGLRLLSLYQPIYAAVDKIFPVEGVRSGLGERYYFAILPGIRELAQAEVKDLAATIAPAQDIASCQSQRGDFQQRKGLFAPPDARFPAETRIIAEWR